MLLILPSAAQAQDSAAAHSASERVLAAAQLPSLATSLRESGITVADVRGTLEALSAADVPATTTAAILEAEGVDAERGGGGNGLGSVVKSKLGEGLRGEALAAAIRTERAAPARPDPGTRPRREQ